MSYTNGAGTGDGVGYAAALTLCGDNSNQFMAGWFYPTTLTATRVYFSLSATTRIAVDTTTDELRITSDWSSTDAVRTTTGADIVVNEWVFIAVLWAKENTGDVEGWRVWIGRQSTPPVIQTPAVTTAGVGTPTGSSTFFLGNVTGGSLAFQGDIGWGVLIGTDTIDINNWSHISNSGEIVDVEAQLVEEQWVMPLWAGRPNYSFMSQGNQSRNFVVTYMNLCQNPAFATQWSHLTTPNEYPAVTVTGATYSDNEPPVRLDPSWVHGRFARIR
jgi:hypothetical protein